MNIGLIGCGNMARALARGWGRPVLCFDPLAERAQALAGESGGRALTSGAAVAQEADLVVLCHKPAQLEQVAHEVAPHAKAVASILAATPLAVLKAAYPGLPVYRFLPSLPVEVRKGGSDRAGGRRSALGAHAGVAWADTLWTSTSKSRNCSLELGTLVLSDDGLVDVAMGLMSCAPAYIALIAEAQVDAGVRRGIAPAQASALVIETLAGTAELLRSREYDTLAVRREVTSPGGTTAKGLDALERGGVRTAFSDALDAVLEERR